MHTYNRRVSRLFLDSDLGHDAVEMTERETRYLGSVLRLKRGDQVLAFNGRGQERLATISSLARRQGRLTLTEHIEPLPESRLDLTLLQALPKMEAMDFVVQKITELGVRSLWPVTSDFSVVRLDSDRAARRAEHWMRVAQSACEQCGRHRPPQIMPVESLEHRLTEVPSDAMRIVLDARLGRPFDAPPEPPTHVFLAIGPEGGFSPSDEDRLESTGFARIRLGPRILRAETAAVAACALLQARWGDLA